MHVDIHQKKYIKQIKYIDGINIIKLILGIIIKKKILIDGLTNGNKIEKIIYSACKEKGIENIKQIKKNLIVPAVDLYNGKLNVFSSKNNRQIYSDDIKYRDTKLIDGGIRENIPWKLTKINGADKVISVIFEKEINTNKNIQKNIINVISNSIDILSHELSNYELAGADYLLKIKTKNIDLLDISKIDYLYEIGYRSTKKNMLDIKNILES